MQILGYDWHPALPRGRVNNNIQPDNGRPRLYIKNDHPSKNIPEPHLVAQAYTDAQK